MLHELHIAGLGVIDDLDLPLHAGLNVLTGETGTGKTMVTVGLSLALGARASASLVREGAGSARVQARFDAPGSETSIDVTEWSEDGELILARTVSAEGKGSARISGQLATASALATLGEHLVEVHGQHQTQRLLTGATQTAFLDRFAGDEHLVALLAYREAFERLRSLRQEVETLSDASRDRERELDLLAYQVREIEEVDPQPGETAQLVAAEARLAHVERLLEFAATAAAVLDGDEGGATSAMATAAQTLAEAAALDPGANELGTRALGSSAEVAELARDVRSYGESLHADPDRLQGIRERMAALRALQRKYGETDDDVRSFLHESAGRLQDLDGADERLDSLRRDLSASEADVDAKAATVRLGRERAAAPLAAAVGAELHQLGMPGAVVRVDLEPVDPPGPGGSERVELRFAAGPGQRSAPLAKTASGGELSRTMLACRSVLADLDQVPTLVFDEVDAGIGGQAGLSVGKRLARLAHDRQVVVVTHLPQIACFADQHVRVTKEGGLARLEVLDHDQRVAELSRMLAGLAESAGAVSHAEELLDEAAKIRAQVRVDA
ncbi:MAG TPA: DNA repair protein RecN [Actinomycetota bacterium]